MTHQHILEGLRARRTDPATRIDMDTIPIPDLYDPAPLATLRSAERTLGFTLPALLGRVYTEVGNGGFGPGSGLLGLEGGYPQDGQVLTDRYPVLVAQGWRDGLLPLWDWGCAAWSCVDAVNPDGPIVTAHERGFTVTRFHLADWLAAWCAGVELHGEIFEIEEATIINPFTRKPRIIHRRGNAKGKTLS